MVNHMDHDDIASLEHLSDQFLQHARHPQNMKTVANPHGLAMGKGSCGDAVEISLALEGETIVDIGHQPYGCAYTVACASAVTVLAKGKTVEEALALQPEDVEQMLGGLPEDHFHCARLAVNTLGEAIAEAYRYQNSA